MFNRSSDTEDYTQLLLNNDIVQSGSQFSAQSTKVEDSSTIINTSECSTSRSSVPPPPPPPPNLGHSNSNTVNRHSSTAPGQDTTTRKQNQPLSSISIQDLNSVQLRRTDSKMLAKTFSAPTRSISMQCLSSTNEQFLSQKTDLIAELKMSKDITGIKKLKVDRAKMDDPRNSEVYSGVNRQFIIENFVDTVICLIIVLYYDVTILIISLHL